MALSARASAPLRTKLALLGGAVACTIPLLLLLLSVTAAWRGASADGGLPAPRVLGNLPDIVVAILGIAITVVSIIVQLSATRYTPRVTELFFRDRTNLLVIGFFLVTSLHCLWINVAAQGLHVRPALAAATLGLVTAALLLLLPYFAYVFAFLQPERLIARLAQRTSVEATEGARDATGAGRSQRRALGGIEQLSDIAANAVNQQDRPVAARGVEALAELVERYQRTKTALASDWFRLGADVARDPDFAVMAPTSVAALAATRTWFEWKVLRQFQALFEESLGRLRDINALVAIGTRAVAEAALKHDDPATLQLALRFFNSYLRASINHRDVRSAYNVLHQYRGLAETLIGAGRSDAVLRVATHLRYYGQTASSAGLPFITETVAHDLAQLCERSFAAGSEHHDALLLILLGVDRPATTDVQERSLLGVRRAQAKLASAYLAAGAEAPARRIWQDLADESAARLQRIRDDLLAATEPEFWEVVDRGQNFDYVEPARREALLRFLAWFPQLTSVGAGSGVSETADPARQDPRMGQIDARG